VRSWPLRDMPRRAVGLLLAAVLLAALVAWLHSWWAGLAALAVLLVATCRVWAPVAYRLGPQGVVQSLFGHGRRTLWSEYRGFEILDEGILLTDTAELTPLGRVTSLYIPYGAQREAIIALADYYVSPHAVQSDSTLRRISGSTRA